MDVFRLLAERKIDEAIAAGEFDELELRGQPLDLSESPWESRHGRLGLRLLRNAGILPPEMDLRRQISELRDHARASWAEWKRRRLEREIEERRLRYRILMGR